MTLHEEGLLVLVLAVLAVVMVVVGHCRG